MGQHRMDNHRQHHHILGRKYLCIFIRLRRHISGLHKHQWYHRRWNHILQLRWYSDRYRVYLMGWWHNHHWIHSKLRFQWSDFRYRHRTKRRNSQWRLLGIHSRLCYIRHLLWFSFQQFPCIRRIHRNQRKSFRWSHNLLIRSRYHHCCYHLHHRDRFYCLR